MKTFEEITQDRYAKNIKVLYNLNRVRETMMSRCTWFHRLSAWEQFEYCEMTCLIVYHSVRKVNNERLWHKSEEKEFPYSIDYGFNKNNKDNDEKIQSEDCKRN